MAQRLVPFLEQRVDNYFAVVNSHHKRIRQLIRQLVIEQVYSGSQPDESYNIKLVDDPSFNDESTYVPDKVKVKLKKWLKSMKLD